MIRVTCPHCDKKMAVDDSKAGKLVRCPGCQTPFRISEAADSTEPAAPPKRASVRLDDAIAPAPKPRRESDRVPKVAAPLPPDDDDDVDEPERKKSRSGKRKKHRKSLAHSNSLLTYILLGVAGVLYVGLLLLSLFTRNGAILFLVVGGILFLLARLWFMYIARQEDETAYIMIRYVPFYAYYYAITRFRELAYPFITGTVGAVFLATAGLVLLAHRNRTDPVDFDHGPGVPMATPAERDHLARQILKSPDKTEARAWLKARPGRRVLALEPAESKQLVDALYAKGAREVVVAQIDTSDPNEEDADSVVVVLPEADRQALFEYLKDRHTDEKDVGQKYLVLQ